MNHVTFYLWKTDATTDFMPALAGQVTVEGDRIDIAPSTAPRIRELVDALRTQPLPLRSETMEGQGAGMKLKLREVMVKPGEADWGYALSEAIAREGGYSVTFTPEPI
ncbi:hypothetical protein D3C87_824720 [compost metagenome]